MSTCSFLPPALAGRFRRAVVGVVAAAAALAGCGGGGGDDDDDMDGPPVVVAPSITQQPAAQTVVAGQPATFTVAATGSDPLAYRWQRNGTDIAGATAATYRIDATVAADSGAAFRAIVGNAAGSVGSDAAVLTVTVPPPVLTVTQQPADAAAVAGTPATFSVAAGCSSGTLTVQWRRLQGAAFADIAGQTATTLTVAASLADNGARFRAALSCSGQAATESGIATLTVTAPATAQLIAVPITGLRDQSEFRFPRSIVREPGGSYAFVADGAIRRLSADLSSITLIAGSSDFIAGSTVDGVGAAARFDRPYGIAADAAGNLYVTEESGHTVRKVAPDGTVTTLAGLARSIGSSDGAGAAARFNSPTAIAIGPDGDLYITDRDNHRIRRMTPAGVVGTYAGQGTFGLVDGPAGAARFNGPSGIAVAGNGVVYVADVGNARIRRISRSGSDAGGVDTFVGKTIMTIDETVDGIGTQAGIFPGQMVLDGGTLYVRDLAHTVRRIDLGTAAVATVTGIRGRPRDLTFDGPRDVATLETFGGIAVRPDGDLLVTDVVDGLLRTVTPAGRVTTFAVAAAFDSGTQGRGGTGVLAQRPFDFANKPPTIGALPDGSLVVGADVTLRRLAADGSVTPIVGAFGIGGVSNVDGVGSAAVIRGARQALTTGADGTIWFFDSFNLRRVDPATRTASGVAGSPTEQGAVDGPAATARFDGIRSLAIGPDGAIYGADTFNRAIRRVDAAGNVTTFAGALGQAGTVDGPRTTARLMLPTAASFAPDGTLWLIDDRRLRTVAADGVVSTLPGLFLHLSVDPAGNVYAIAENGDLVSVAPGSGATTRLIARAPQLVLGADPRLGATQQLTAVGVRQLVLTSEGRLLRATLP